MFTGVYCHNGGLTKDAVSVCEAMSNRKMLPKRNWRSLFCGDEERNLPSVFLFVTFLRLLNVRTGPLFGKVYTHAKRSTYAC